MTTLPFAEDINYWQTSQSSPDSWMDKSKKLIQQLSGTILAEGFGSDSQGRSAYMLAFEIKGDRFKVIWPVLPSKTRNERAARIQAATMLHHDIKAKAMSATVLGARVAFFNNWMLPDGRTAANASVAELSAGIPLLFQNPQLSAPLVGEIVEEGEA